MSFAVRTTISGSNAGPPGILPPLRGFSKDAIHRSFQSRHVSDHVLVEQFRFASSREQHRWIVHTCRASLSWRHYGALALLRCCRCIRAAFLPSQTGGGSVRDSRWKLVSSRVVTCHLKKNQ